MHPQTRYTKVGDARVAYQVIGDGPIDLVYTSGLAANVDIHWDFPPMATFLERLASFSRLIMFDRRGLGLSDHDIAFPGWERWAQDLDAVLREVASERPAVVAGLDSAAMILPYAAANPGRLKSLVLWNAYARSTITDDYAIGLSQQTSDATIGLLEQWWGTEEMARMAEPSYEGDADALAMIAKWMRAACTPTVAAAHDRYMQAFDARFVLGDIDAPTLVLHRENSFLPAELGRYIADNIRGARFETVPGAGVGIYSEHADTTLERIEKFVTS